MLRNSILFVIAGLMLAGACAALAETGKTSLNSKSLSDLHGYLLNNKPDLDQFRLRGPFAVTMHKNYEIRLSPRARTNTDLFLSAHAERAPLVIILHGYGSSKEAHTQQAMHLASWGMHSLILQLPSKGSWVNNGKTLASILNAIYRRPEIIDTRVDVNKLILAGHSFGGASVGIALAEGVPAAGGILLDPAVVIKDFPNVLRKINTPVMLLGADEEVSSARNRGYFYRYIRSGIAEVSIKDAAHEDAQFPSHPALSTEELQITFVSAFTSSALSLSSTGKFDYAWSSFSEGLKNGRLVNAKRK